MRPNRKGRRTVFAILVCALLAAIGYAQGCNGGGSPERSPAPSSAVNPAPMSATMDSGEDVLTYHNDNQRTGQYLHETILTPVNVRAATFGQIGFLATQGLVDAEPLFLSKLNIAGVTRRVVFVATEHDLAYAFDADTRALLWKVSVLLPGETTSDSRTCGQVSPEIGITSTPVIDPKAGQRGVVYLVAMSKNSRGQYFQRLHALDATTGAEMPASPQTIAATFPGTGAESKNGILTFDAKQYEERAALLLANGVVYTTWTSHCDDDPYNGWLIGYDQSTLKQVAVLNLTPNGDEGATWMSGDGPAADPSGNIYLLSGNGTFDTVLDAKGFPSRGNFGNAFLKIGISGGTLAVTDYFTSHETVSQSNKDEDLGSGGLLLLPDLIDDSGAVRRLAIGAGKDQIIYVADRDSMGKFNSTGDRIYQEVSGSLDGPVFATPAYFSGSVYYGAVRDSLKAFPLSHGKLAASPASRTSAQFSYPGATPSISADGASNGIVWAVESAGEIGEKNPLPGILHAYDTSNLANEYYSSAQSGPGARFADNKFVTPMIAKGQLYVGTPSGVAVFGLLPGKK